MNALDAAATALASAGGPLHYREITERILQDGLWVSEGKSPEATVNARIAVDIKQAGTTSRFVRTSPGIFNLRNGSSAPSANVATSTSAGPASNQSRIASTAAQTLSFTNATEQVLRQLANKQPMHYKIITAEALKLGLVSTTGQTPDETLRSLVRAEIDRYTQRGRTPRFVKHGKGYIGLSEWLPSPLVQQINQHNNLVRTSLHQQLLSMTPGDFEALTGRLLAALGFEVVVTKLSGDGGVDVRGTLVVGDVIKIGMAVQVKRWKNNVQAPTVHMVRGSLSTHEHGMIVTTSDFSAGARADAQKSNAVPVALMNGAQLVDLLVEHGIGIHKGAYGLLELGDADDS